MAIISNTDEKNLMLHSWKAYSEKEDCAGWVTFCGWTTDGYHNRHYTGRFQVSREDQVDQELTG